MFKREGQRERIEYDWKCGDIGENSGKSVSRGIDCLRVKLANVQICKVVIIF